MSPTTWTSRLQAPSAEHCQERPTRRANSGASGRAPAVGALNPPGSEEQGDSLVIRAEIVSPSSEAEKSENHVLIFES